MLTQKQLQHRLGVTPLTLYQWRSSQDPLPHHTIQKKSNKPGRLPVIHYDPVEVDDWVKKYKPLYVGKANQLCGCSYCEGRERTERGRNNSTASVEVVDSNLQQIWE